MLNTHYVINNDRVVRSSIIMTACVWTYMFRTVFQEFPLAVESRSIYSSLLQQQYWMSNELHQQTSITAKWAQFGRCVTASKEKVQCPRIFIVYLRSDILRFSELEVKILHRCNKLSDKYKINVKPKKGE